MHYAKYKTILSPQNGMNLYRGCTHGCIYCDSRSKCYQVKHQFEDIEVKESAPEILANQLKRKRQPVMIATGSMSDPYIHLELKLQQTRKCLEVIEKYGFGVTLHTKSARILTDLDILKRINYKTKAVVQITLTTFNDSLCKILEPEVSTTSERVAVLKKLNEEGIPTVVWLGPFLPFINDNPENILGLLNYCLEANVKGIVCFGIGVTMREGNREYFYQKLDQSFPGMKQRYINAFGNRYGCRSQNHDKIMRIIRNFCQKHQILYNRKTFEYLAKFESQFGQLSMF